MIMVNAPIRCNLQIRSVNAINFPNNSVASVCDFFKNISLIWSFTTLPWLCLCPFYLLGRVSHFLKQVSSFKLKKFYYLKYVFQFKLVVTKKKDDRSVIKVKEGDTISLSCDRGTVTQETLYAVKWYKDEKEFFRNYPKADNPVKVYPIEGFTLEVDTLLHNLNLKIDLIWGIFTFIDC